MSLSRNTDDAFGSSVGLDGHAHGRSAAEDVKPHLEGKERLKVYIAISALIEIGGFSLREAAAILLKEYQHTKTPVERRKVRAVELFFGGLKEGITRDEVVVLANKTFGAAFMPPEESSVLSLLAHDVDPVAVFKSCRQIIEASA